MICLSITKVGALLCLWSKVVFQISNSFVGKGFIGLEGIWNRREKFRLLLLMFILHVK